MRSPYRQAVLERLASPERLDEAIRTIRPRMWLALGVTLVLIAASVVWSLTGRIDVRTTATGALVTPDSLEEVLSPVDGYVVAVADENTDVTAGQVVARIRRSVGGGPVTVARAPITGRLFESEVRVGELVRRGESLSRVQSATAARGRGLQALTYVSPGTAASLRPGMPVRITPVTVPSAEYGFLEGRVRSVGTIPASDNAIVAAVQDSNLARGVVAGAAGLPTEVRVQLEKARTPSGYGWTTGSGPPFALADGTLATLEITTGRRKPLDYLTGQ